MAFGNAHIETAARHLLHHNAERAARGHSGSDANDFLVLLRKFEHRVTKHILETRRLALFATLEAFASFGVEKSRSVPLRRHLFGRSKALTFGSVYVQHLRATHILDGAQRMHEFHHVVSVHGAKVADIHTLEDVLLLGEEALHAIIEADKAFAATLVHQSEFAQHLGKAVAPLVVAGRGGEAQQIALEAAHGAVNRHFIVVEDDEHIVVALRSVVQSFEGKAATHGSITDDGHHTATVVALLLGCYGHTECCRDRVRGVSTSKGVVFALLGRGEGFQALKLAVGVELLATTCENLVRVCLVAYVPHKAVVGRVEHIVQRYGEFDDSERRTKVSGVLREFADDELAQLFAQLRQLRELQTAQIVGVLYGV